MAIAKDPAERAEPDDQAQHRRRRDRRLRGARARQHRPGGRDAGDGGQGAAVQASSPASTPGRSASTTQDTDEIVRIVECIAPGFGGINLEDIAAPRCFEVEERLRATLDIPVFHDDQHGTAVVVFAALLNALRVVGKQMREVRVVVPGVGRRGRRRHQACCMAAGVAPS